MFEVVLMNKNTRKTEKIRVEASGHAEAWERARKALEFNGKKVSDYYVKTSHKIAEDTQTNQV